MSKKEIFKYIALKVLEYINNYKNKKKTEYSTILNSVLKILSI